MKRARSVGIIGAGSHGSRYALHLLRDVPGLTLAAISRRSPEGKNQAREWGARWHRDWVSLVDDPAVEAVIAVTPPHLNPSIAEACSSARKPLLVEKPLASSEAEAAGMVEACSKAGIPLTVGQTLRYNTVVQAMVRELSRAGALHSFSANQRLEPASHGWLDDPEVAGGGVTHHTAVHLFDALRFITGREVIRVRASTFRRIQARLEDLLTAQVEMEGGLVGIVDTSKVGPARTGRFEFVGSEGHLQGEQIHGRLEFVDSHGITSLQVDRAVNTVALLLADWARCLDGSGPNPIPGEEGLAAVRICDACRRSAGEGHWEEITISSP